MRSQFIRQSILATALLLPAAALAQPVSLSTLPPGAINNVQAQVAAKVIQQHSGMQVRVATFNSPAAILGSTQNNQAEFAWTSNDEMGAAFRGKDEYKGKAMKNLRVAATIFSFDVGLMVKADGPIKKITDLKGQVFPTGWQGFTQGIAIMNAILAPYDMSMKDLKPFPSLNLIRAADDFKAGKTVGTMFAVGAPKVAEVHSAIGGVRFLDIVDSPEALKKIAAVRPEYHLGLVNPAPHLPGIVGPTHLLQYYLVLVTNDKVKDEVVYKAVKAMHDNKKDMAAGHPSFNAINPDNMAYDQGDLQYHPGAIKYFKEIGIWKR